MSSSNAASVTIIGGVTRVQHGAEEAQQEQFNAETSRVHDGSLTLDPVTGQVAQQGTMRVNSADLQRQHGFGVLATARTAYGSPARELTSDSIIEYQGMTMRLSEAEQVGLVKRDSNGRYMEIGAEERTARQAASEYRAAASQPKATEAGDVNGMKAELFPPVLEEGLAKLSEGVAPQTINHVLMDAAFDALHGKSVNLEAVTSLTGMSPDRAEQFMGAALVALSGQADGALRQMGVTEPDLFVDWARRERPDQFRQAIVQQVGVRSLEGYRHLAKDFIRSTSPDAAGLGAAGFETMTDPRTKELLVKWQGVWTSAKALAIQGAL